MVGSLASIAQWMPNGHRDLEAAKAIAGKAASKIIPEIAAGRDAKLTDFEAEHAKDADGYEFRCERYGNFLVVFMSRGEPATNAMGASERQKIAIAINAGAAKTINLALGYLPDMTGTASLDAQYYSPERVTVVYGHAHKKARMVEAEAAVGIDAQSALAQQYYGMQTNFLAGTHVQDCPRPAADDSIAFDGIATTIYAPAGLGQGVFDQIMKALGS